jgi:hypothetical protein
MVWLTTGGIAATHTALSDSGDKNEGSESSAVLRNNVGRSQTTIASLTSTTAKINVFGYGFATPSGELSFTDITDGNPFAAPVKLNTATSTTTLLPQVATNTGANTLPDWTELADLNGDGILDLVPHGLELIPSVYDWAMGTAPFDRQPPS